MKPHLIFRAFVVTVFLGCAFAGVQSAHAATYMVDSTADPTESGKTTLRDAILVATDGDTINFAASVTGTITLTSGELYMGSNVTINGPGANVLAINGNAASRVFNVGGVVTISGLTITNGSDSFGAGLHLQPPDSARLHDQWEHHDRQWRRRLQRRFRPPPDFDRDQLHL